MSALGYIIILLLINGSIAQNAFLHFLNDRATASNIKNLQEACEKEICVDKWIDLGTNTKCYALTIDQILMEFDACYTYLDMASHFSRDAVNRPGLADYFFDAAKDEREHGAKLIDYLSLRGQLNNVTGLQKLPNINTRKWKSGADAIKAALDLEAKVTKSIRKLIETCENEESKMDDNSTETKPYNFYHFVDYLTGIFLEEQLRSQRDLAAKLSTLSKLESDFGNLGEFMFDKALLNSKASTSH